MMIHYCVPRWMLLNTLIKLFYIQANTVEGMFEYFEEVLVPALADMSIADHDYATIGSNHFLLGPCRLRQKRIRKGIFNPTALRMAKTQ